MKKLIFAIILLVTQCVVFAANPGFGSFNVNQFDVTGNRVALTNGVILTNAIIHGELTSDSSATGSEFFGDGGSFGYRITPPTMSGFINFIPDTSAQTGVPLHTATGTNVVETHLPLVNFGYGLWTNAGSSTTLSTAPNVAIGQLPSTLPANVLTFTLQGTNNNEFFQLQQGAHQMNAYGAIENDAQSVIWDGGWYQYSDGTNAFQTFLFRKLTGSVVYTLLDPGVDLGLVPYIFGTSKTVSSGNLVEVKNNTTNAFTINNLGAVIPSGNTNQITTGSGRLKFDAVNVVTASSTDALTEKTFNAASSGNVLSQIKSLKLQFPRLIDGAGCTYANTNDYTALTFMLPQFSGTGATNANYCDFAFRVPSDLDTSVDLTASLTVRLTAADTSGHTYDVGMVSIANSGAAAGTPANYVALTVSGDGSGASGDIESVSAVTLTSWKSNLTAGQWCLLRLNRDGATDASTVASNLMELEIFYTSTQ